MKYTVHPAAEAFPMLPDDELQELAAHIKANGLIHPIMLDKAGELLCDGRNRYRACEIAGVEPRFDRLNGIDPREYIIAANITRRNITLGQKALAIALIYPKGEKLGRGKVSQFHDTFGDEAPGTTRNRIWQARQIIAYPDLVNGVRSGATSFDAAVTEARKRDAQAENEDTHLTTLRAEAADLAQQVADETLTLPEAWAAFDQRKKDAEAAEKSKRDTLLRMAEALYRGATAFAVKDFSEAVRVRMSDEEFKKELVARLRLDGPINDLELLAGVAALSDILREV